MRSILSRNASIESVIKSAVESGTNSLRCACPGIVQSWNADAQTVTVKLAIKEMLNLEGVETETEIPLLVDVPIVTPRAGGFALLMVPAPGDECLVVFSDMCIDSWWQSGGIQSQAERRRHDLSDGFAILGVWSQPNKPTSYPEEGISLRNNDGSVAITIDSEGCHFTGINVGIKDLDSNDNGVAVGMESTATEAEKKFEVADDHKAYFNGGFDASGSCDIQGSLQVHDGLYDSNGSFIGNTFSTYPVQIGTWVDGRAIYRKVFTNVSMSTSTTTLSLGVTVDVAIRLYGMMKAGTNWHPVNSYYSSSYHAYARLSKANQVTLHGGTADMSGFIVLEYVGTAD